MLRDLVRGFDLLCDAKTYEFSDPDTDLATLPWRGI